MAQKRRASPLDEPPTASSSSEEEETSSESESEDDVPEKPASTSQPLASGKKSIVEKPQPVATVTKPQAKASSSESETESDSGSDSEDDRPTVAADTVGKSTPKAKKMKSQPSETPARSALKRPIENNQAASDSKRAKKKGKEVAGGDETPIAENGGKKAGEESKKPFQRLWSEDDEIAILKGMTAFSEKMGADPYREIISFHDFIKKSLHIDVSNDQLSNKIRRMKQKYKKIAAELRKNGARLTKPHDIEAFELSKKIWGTEGENGGTELFKSDEKVQKKGKDSNAGPSSKPETELKSKEVRRQIFTDQNAGSSPIISEMIRFDKNLGLSRLDEDALRREVELIEPSKRAELEDRMKKLHVAELELFVKRADLMKYQATLILEAYKSNN